MNVFNDFCKYVDSRIFSKENVGTMLAFIVDQSFITEFCTSNSISEKMLMDSVRSNLYSVSTSNILKIKGVLAIQMYAASKRANSDGVTDKNYRERLSKVLNWPMDHLQNWMESYQENTWEALYRWCDTHYYEISKCSRKSGPYRYTQYPVLQALCVFSEEDLLYIAGAFVANKLQPNEDIQETDFWRIVSRRSVLSYFRTSHSRDVLDTATQVALYRQIYNYYLRWNGDYKDWNTTHRHERNSEERYLYLTGDFTNIEFRNGGLKLLRQCPTSELTYNQIRSEYNFKREGIIVFSKDDVYNNYWQESRYVEKGQEGIVLIFKSQYRGGLFSFSNRVLFETSQIKICRLEYSYNTAEYFAEKRFYALEGGLRIGRNTYLYGGAPILTMTKSAPFFIDGELFEKEVPSGRLNLSFLKEGLHTIQFVNCKKLLIELTASSFTKPIWLAGNNCWQISEKDCLWNSVRSEDGIVGLDFSSVRKYIPQKKRQKPLLQRWSEIQTYGKISENEMNPIINILKNTNSYE